MKEKNFSNMILYKKQIGLLSSKVYIRGSSED